MINDLDELYKQVILDHNKNPRNFGVIENANSHAKGHNPLCGDQLDLYLVIEDGLIKDVKFNGSGCAISKASASIMTSLIKGKTIEEAKQLFDEFHNLVTSDPEAEIDTSELGKLEVFCGVREFPARIKCASLPWHTLAQAINEKSKSELITTEDLNV
jgi:nitrogen fixation NifU-like protein